MLLNLLSFTLSLSICFLILKKFHLLSDKFRLLDFPNHRSLHIVPKPRGAGLAFIISTFIYSILNSQFIFFLGLPLIIIAFVDDLKGVSSIIRYGFQLFTVISYFFIIFFNVNQSIFFQSQLPSLIIIICIFGFTGIINFINFMDGSDGLVAAVMAVVFLFAGILISKIFLIISFSLIIFLKFNFPPARYFMGDIGSIFLGLTYILALMLSPSIDVFLGLLIINTPLLYDPFITVIKRFINRENIFLAHNSHLYQRLNKAGFSNKNIVFIYLLPTVLLSIIYFVTNIKILLLLSLFIFLYGYYYEDKIKIMQ
tara:strand:+ start:17410 stop:18345 length:936 start_codon:yes stop_codon:yes gene_type:complete